MRTPRVRAVARGAGAVGAIGLGLAAVLAIVPSIGSDRVGANDFIQDYVSARALAVGEDPYAPTDVLFRRYLPEETFFHDVSQRNPHPPALLFVFRPLGELPVRTARAIWLGVSAATYVTAAFALSRALGAGPVTAVAAAIGTLAIPVVQKDLNYGQSNALLLALIVIGWIAVRRDRTCVAGVAFGAAAALKFFPLLLLIPFARRRRWSGVGWMAGTFVVTTAAAAIAVGSGASTTFARDITSANASYWAPAPMNLSLTAIPLRWLTHNEFYAGPDLPVLARTLAAAILIAIVVVAWRRAGRVEDPVAAMLPLMLLGSPLTWEFSLILLVPLGFTVVRDATARRAPPSPAWMLGLAIVALGIPVGLPPPGSAGVAWQLLGYAIPTYGLTLIAILDGRRRSAELSYSS